MRNHFALLTLAGLIAACGSGADRSNTETANAPAAQADAQAAVDTPATAPQLDDPTIVAIFDAANTFDIETGQLALGKAQSKDVKNLARQFVNDHKAVRQQGRDLAKRLSVTPTPPAHSELADQHTQAMAELRGKSGKEFDRAYLAHEVAFHQAVIDAVKTTLLPATQNAELKALEQKVAPAFQAHLEAAKSLQQRMGS